MRDQFEPHWHWNGAIEPVQLSLSPRPPSPAFVVSPHPASPVFQGQPPVYPNHAQFPHDRLPVASVFDPPAVMAPRSQLVAHVAAGMTDLYLQDMQFAPQQTAVVVSPQDTSAWGALPARAERPIYPYSSGSISHDGRAADVQKQTENAVGAGMKTRQAAGNGSHSVLAADAEKQARLKLEQEKVALLMRLKVAETRASEAAVEKERLLQEGERVRRQAQEDAERLVRQAKEHEQANLETSRLLQAFMAQASRGLVPAAQPLAPAPISRARGAFQGESVTESEIPGAAHRKQQEARLRENIGVEPQSVQNIPPVDRGVQATIWRSASTQTQATEPLAKETRFEGEETKSLQHRTGTTLHGTPSKHPNDRHHHHRFGSVRLCFRCSIEPCAHLTKKLCGRSGWRQRRWCRSRHSSSTHHLCSRRSWREWRRRFLVELAGRGESR